MGALHRALAPLEVRLPRPLAATYAPPSTLRRWVPVTVAAVRHDPEAAALARLLADLVARLRRRWLPASALPVQLVHGDVRLSNVRPTTDGRTLYLDFGFAARRPRSARSSTRIVTSDEVALSQLGEGSSRRGGGQRSST